MFKLIRGARVLAPEDIGRKEILICGERIAAIEDAIDLGSLAGRAEVLDGAGLTVTPGFVDGHVHIMGGGGEGGFHTRTPEVDLTDATTAGVTTVVGVIGTDGNARHMEALLAKARGLEEEGITAYVYTGAYQVPPPTICGDVRSDIINIDKVIGCGEVAISDHRSAYPTKAEIAKLAAQARVAGMLSGKAGVLHLHVGDGREKLALLHQLAEESEIPIKQFRPTHVNRNPELMEDAILFAKKGGVIDLTSCISREDGVKRALSCAQALRLCLDRGAPLENITMSSDGNGAMAFLDERGNPAGLLVARLSSLHGQLRKMVQEEGIPLPSALSVVTSNPAEHLKLWRKGRVEAGRDADLLLLDDRLSIVHVLARGRLMVRDGAPVVRGTFTRTE